MRIIHLAVCCMMVVCLNCANLQEPGQVPDESASAEDDAKAILALEQEIFAAEIAGDLDGWLGYFTDEVLLMPPNEPALRGKEAVRAWAAPFYGQFDLHEETDEREVEVVGDWGYIRANWIWTLTPKGGGEATTDAGKSIWILRRQTDGSWKVAQAIWNSDNPVSETR